MAVYNTTFRYVLADDARIFPNGTDEIRIRKGVWNYEEAALSLQSLGEHQKQAITGLFDALHQGATVELESALHDANLSEEEKEQITGFFQALQARSFLQLEEDSKTRRLLCELIGGIVLNQFEQGIALRPVLFLADTRSIKDYAQRLAGEIGLPLTIMTDKEYTDLATIDLTTRFDGFETRKQTDEWQKYIEPFSCIVGSMERPHIGFLRNLNRLLIPQAKPLSLSFMDGPFMSLLTIKPPETGCFECFENRLLARMEDMSVYRNFVSRMQHQIKSDEKIYASPLLQTLTSTAIFEGLMISAVNKAKLAGRLLSIYIPTLEIQVQDLLRVPFCPACGFVSEAQMDEMYTSSKRIVDKIIDKVVING